jgi:hypothetical protein
MTQKNQSYSATIAGVMLGMALIVTTAGCNQALALIPSIPEISEGRYAMGGADQGLQVQGSQYRYYDEGGEKPWRPLSELASIHPGVVYDGNYHWCLLTSARATGAIVCSQDGWVVPPVVQTQKPPHPSTNNAQTQSNRQLTAIPKLKKGMSYDRARQLIIDAGWQPIVTTTDNPLDGTSGWRQRGYNEVYACSGTGMGFCRFEFSGSGQRKFVAVTAGRDSTLHNWWSQNFTQTQTINREQAIERIANLPEVVAWRQYIAKQSGEKVKSSLMPQADHPVTIAGKQYWEISFNESQPTHNHRWQTFWVRGDGAEILVNDVNGGDYLDLEAWRSRAKPMDRIRP